MNIGITRLPPTRARDTLPMIASDLADPIRSCGHEALVHGAGGCLVEYSVQSPLCGTVAMSSRAGAMAVVREVAGRTPGHWVSLWTGDDVQHYRAKRDGRFVRARTKLPTEDA